MTFVYLVTGIALVSGSVFMINGLVAAMRPMLIMSSKLEGSAMQILASAIFLLLAFAAGTAIIFFALKNILWSLKNKRGAMKNLFRSKAFLVIQALACVFLAAGCATTRNAVPPELVTRAGIRGMEEVRTVMGASHTLMEESLVESVKQESAEDFPHGPDGVKEYPILAISGGGANGAYGAGLLKGWTKSGSRPVFKVVTGVSTGAIIAPFAFMGSEYDAQIEQHYTTLSTKDVMSSKGPLAALFGNSLASNKPLEKTIAGIVDKNFLEKIAAEHRAAAGFS